MSTERILIAGCGKLGTALGRELSEAGHTVWGLRRRAERIPEPIRPLAGDLADPASLPALPEALDRIYYIATPGAYDDTAYQRAYVHGLRNLLAALPNPDGRLVFVSSTSVYGQSDGREVDESSPTEPTGFSGQRMLEAEHIALGWAGESVVVRFGGIYGPGRTRMIDKVRHGEACTAHPPAWSNRIHQADCVGVLAHLGAARITPGVYLAVDDAPCTQCELMDWLAEQLGLPQPPRRNVGAGGFRAGSKRCRNDKLRASGYRFRYPSYREGYAAMLKEM
ncbi:SDR family oxidoreductase [Alkalilimnicola sp. S0819]|uniref:SDR family oxidoreductase n=1 Tax=Alkalilimnicola sp. S0819 TaxID=2613922 RepID=UPI001262A493|nr:SDR family oxidoreductase [Alkalilimnicola sp. S0819]KAB7623218.1 SDR family oxidoreductase [Alkalilimnicola sp. S0819]MPQ17067.1 NAD-dependent epimerase/dehydratase family protein [Alkalilimnicola sp. S0819]